MSEVAVMAASQGGREVTDTAVLAVLAVEVRAVIPLQDQRQVQVGQE